MTAPAPSPLFAPRERRVLLWLTVAAVCWRWLLAVRAPLPGLDACGDLWLAEQIASGDFGALALAWWRPWWALAVAVPVAAGADAFAAAQVLGCVAGGLALWPAAVAAERLRQGAGLPAAVFVLAAGAAARGAGVGSSLPFVVLLAAAALASWTKGRAVTAVAVAALAAAGGVERLAPDDPSGPWAAWGWLRSAWSLAAPFAVLSVLPPRPRRIALVWIAAVLVLGWAAAVPSAASVLLTWSPVASVLAGVGLARLPSRLRELALVAAVAVDFLGAWQQQEPRAAVAERLLGRHLRDRLGPADVVVADLPRVLYFAGQRPAVPADAAALLQAARAPAAAFVVLGTGLARSATATAALAATHARYDVPPALRDLAAVARLQVYARRE